MDARLKALVRRRANLRCEYCHLPEQIAEMSLQIEHIIAEQHGGPSAAENLALACGRCNRHKGTNLSGIDPESRSLTRLFNPRADSWEEHFEWKGACLTGRTAVGRTTIMVLRINHPEAVGHRKDLINEGHEL